MQPTAHLRFVERQELDRENSTHEYIAHRTIRVLQQFYETPNGKDVMGDMFVQTYGKWVDVPLVKGNI